MTGYPARSIAKVNEFPSKFNWYPSPRNSTLQYEGDTLSDEIVGHLFVYPLVGDILSSNDHEREQTYSLLINIKTSFLSNW